VEIADCRIRTPTKSRRDHKSDNHKVPRNAGPPARQTEAECSNARDCECQPQGGSPILSQLALNPTGRRTPPGYRTRATNTSPVVSQGPRSARDRPAPPPLAGSPWPASAAPPGPPAGGVPATHKPPFFGQWTGSRGHQQQAATSAPVSAAASTSGRFSSPVRHRTRPDALRPTRHERQSLERVSQVRFSGLKNPPNRAVRGPGRGCLDPPPKPVPRSGRTVNRCSAARGELITLRDGCESRPIRPG